MRCSPRLGEEKKTRIAKEGTKAAKAKFERSRAAVRQAMKAIESDIEKNGGIYPFADGRLSTAEVLRRAGKSEAYLRKTGSEELTSLKKEVDAWVDRVLSAIGSGVRIVRRNITARMQSINVELHLLRQAYAEAELEHSETLRALASAQREVSDLKARNDSLMRELSSKTVIDLRTRN